MYHSGIIACYHSLVKRQPGSKAESVSLNGSEVGFQFGPTVSSFRFSYAAGGIYVPCTTTSVETAGFQKPTRAFRFWAEVSWEKAFAAAAAGGQEHTARDGSVGEDAAVGGIGAEAGNLAVSGPAFVELAGRTIEQRAAWSKVVQFSVVAVAQGTADSALTFGIGTTLVFGGSLAAFGFTRGDEITKKSRLSPRWMDILERSWHC